MSCQCKGTGSAHCRQLTSSVADATSHTLAIQDDALVDVLTDIILPTSPPVHREFDVQDDAMVDVLSDIEIPEYPHSCRGFTDNAYQGHFIGIISGTSSQPSHLLDNAMLDVLTDISVPSPPAIPDNDTYSFEGQDNALADTLKGIEIPSPP